MDQSISWEQIVNRFRESCSNFDHVWMKRRRTFDTFSLTSSMLDLVAGSESSYVSVMNRFQNDCIEPPAASSFCEARAKVPSYIFSEISRNIYDHITELTEPLDWFGYTPLALDGSKINIPTKMRGKTYQIVSGFTPSALLTSLVRITDRMVFGLKISSSFDERELAHEFLEDLSEEHLVVYDRGYISFSLLNDHINRGIGGVFRVPSGNIFRELNDFMMSDSVDEVIQIDPTDATYRNAKKANPNVNHSPIEVRAIKYNIGTKTYLLATTITEKTIPAKAFVNLYKNRWRIEEFLKSFKMTIDAEYFHSLSENGIEQEINCGGILWNLSRSLDLIHTPLKKTEAEVKNIALSVQF